MYLDVISLETLPDFRILLVFENGEKRVFDLQPLLDKRPWQPLAQRDLFAQASVAFGTVIWPGNIDIAPETLYDRSVPAEG